MDLTLFLCIAAAAAAGQLAAVALGDWIKRRRKRREMAPLVDALRENGWRMRQVMEDQRFVDMMRKTFPPSEGDATTQRATGGE